MLNKRLTLRVGTTCLTLVLLCACGGGDSAPAVKLPDPSKMFSWTTSEKVIGFSHSADLFPVESFSAGTAQALPTGNAAQQALAQSVTYQYGSNADGSARTGNTVDDYMAHSKATGLLVIKNGTVVLEKYAMGVNASTLWDGKSVSKSVTSTLVGAAIKDGLIHSLDDTVETYVPELRGSAYEGVKLLHMIRMASGVKWNENELDPTADLPAMLKCATGAGADACILNFMKTLPRATDSNTGAPAVPGAVFNYNTGEAYLTGLAVQRATGMSLAKYLEQKIWKPAGMEAGGNWWTFNGVSTGGSGFNATLRDFGRFGQFILNNGVLANGTKVLPDNWVRDATTWTAASAIPYYADNGQYGYMWWFSPSYEDEPIGGTNHPSPIYVDVGAPIQNADASGGAVPIQARPPVQGQPSSVSDWTFAAVGIYGQMIAINQRENLVVVQWSAWDKPDPVCCDKTSVEYDASNPYNEEAVFVNALLKALH